MQSSSFESKLLSPKLYGVSSRHNHLTDHTPQSNSPLIQTRQSSLGLYSGLPVGIDCCAWANFQLMIASVFVVSTVFVQLARRRHSIKLLPKYSTAMEAGLFDLRILMKILLLLWRTLIAEEEFWSSFQSSLNKAKATTTTIA
ncbi:uncharacterized protein [Physcomitrium patens]|uniref:Uncharacterized protein n=1 Tax=Physcomitrium patens TaxID=3218 RepID=A0A2K1KJ91_PHYPA|nr:hypothetical protein PHYPA_007521 [Physcomitrium patens]